jgi:signal transduction histidine kinase
MGADQLIAPIVSIGGLGVAITSTFLAVRQYYDRRMIEDRQRQLTELDRYAAGEKKAYAAERDFNHLMRKYDSLSANITTLMDFQRNEVQTLEGDVKEVKALLSALLVQVTGSETAAIRVKEGTKKTEE